MTEEWPAEKVVEKLVEALHAFHAVDIANCPFGKLGEGKFLIHGDATLPNIMFENDRLSGFIDVGDVMVDAIDKDLSAAIWSLQYNLGPGYGKMFLEKYGVKDVTDSKVEELRLMYEDMQVEWGL